MKRRGLLIALCASNALGCFYATLDHDELEAKAAGALRPAADAGVSESDAGFTTALDTPPIEILVNGEPDTTNDPCVATSQQARAILESSCAPCHAPPAGMGGFRSILDLPVLVTLTSSTQRDLVTGQPVRLLVPGKPDESRVYRRVAGNEMPPMGDPALAPRPRPSISDVSVLRAWIQDCIAAPPPPALPPSTLPDAGQ